MNELITITWFILGSICLSQGCYVYRIGDTLKMPGTVTSKEVVDTGNGIETLIGFSDGRIIKIRGSGGKGSNMFKVTSATGGFKTVKPLSYLIGSAHFWSAPTIIKHIKDAGVTLIAFRNGKILKVRGTGGGGFNMFAVTESAVGFAGVSGYNYRIGSAKFPAMVTAMMYVKAKQTSSLTVAFANGRILKVRGTGGGGYNLFAVFEDSADLTSVKGYNYRIGAAAFSSPVVAMKFIKDTTVMALANGRMLKFRGTGGSGSNMYAVTETSSGITGLPSYDLLIGQAKLSSVVTSLTYLDDVMLIGFKNGKLMKVKGSGGIGNNMFDVIETSGGFNVVPGSNYLVGWAKFISSVNEIVSVEDSFLITFADGKILKIRGTGGSGPNFLAVTETMNGFKGKQGHHHYEGHAKFTSSCLHVMYINEKLVMAFQNGFILKLEKIGGLNGNMFHIDSDISVGFFNKCQPENCSDQI